MAIFGKRTSSEVADPGSASGKSRKIRPAEERQKRGRWVLPIVLVVTLLASLWFWYS